MDQRFQKGLVVLYHRIMQERAPSCKNTPQLRKDPASPLQPELLHLCCGFK